MAIINKSKPVTGVPKTHLNIGIGFSLLTSGVYKLVIGPENLTAGVFNVSKVSIGETWGTIASTWATEAQTWLGASQLIGNTDKPVSIMNNKSKPT